MPGNVGVVCWGEGEEHTGEKVCTMVTRSIVFLSNLLLGKIAREGSYTLIFQMIIVVMQFVVIQSDGLDGCLRRSIPLFVLRLGNGLKSKTQQVGGTSQE